MNWQLDRSRPLKTGQWTLRIGVVQKGQKDPMLHPIHRQKLWAYKIQKALDLEVDARILFAPFPDARLSEIGEFIYRVERMPFKRMVIIGEAIEPSLTAGIYDVFAVFVGEDLVAVKHSSDYQV